MDLSARSQRKNKGEVRRDRGVGLSGWGWRLGLACALVVSSGGAAQAAQRLEFGQPVADPLPSSPTPGERAVEVVDLNRDRRDDIAVVTAAADGSASQIAVYLQLADGTLAAPQRFEFQIAGARVGTVVVGDTGEIEDAARTLVVGSLAQLTFLDYDPTSARFSLRQVSIPDCQCDRLVSWFDANITFHIAAPTIASGELLVVAWDGVFSEIVQRGAIGLAGSRVTDIAARKVAPAGIVLASETNGLYWIPLGAGQAPGAARRYEGLGSGQSPHAVAVGPFFGVAASVSSGGSDARILFLTPEDGQLVARTSFPSSHPASALRAVELDGQHLGFGGEDLLVGQGEARSIAYYLGNPVAPQLEREEGVAVADAAFYARPDGVAAGDVNGDGVGDVVYADAQALHVAYGRLRPLRDVVNDFDGDGRSDLFWQHDDARRVIWRAADARAQIAVARGTDPLWMPGAIADFDGNGFDDLLLRHDGDGSVRFWMYGTNVDPPLPVSRIARDWRIVTSGDFDGDGADDLVWRHSVNGRNVIWNGGDYYDQRAMTAVTDTRWAIVGAGDFDGDGRDDLVWRHQVTGSNVIWLGADYRRQQAVTSVTGQDWRIAAVADFDGDGRDDLFWRHASGRNTIWSAANAAARIAVSSRSSPWLLAAAGDYDGDGRDGIVWRHRDSGQNVLWPGAQEAQARELTAVTDTRWRLY